MNDLADSHRLRFCVGVLAGADGGATLEEFLNRVFAVSRFSERNVGRPFTVGRS